MCKSFFCYFVFFFKTNFSIHLDSPWTTSMPCLFSNNSNNNYENNQEFNNNNCLISSLNNLDLSNPFNIIASLSPTSSNWSLNNFNTNFQQINQQELQKNYFEPLPFFNTQNQIKQNNYPQLSQKHTIIKQSILSNFFPIKK